MNHKLLLVIVFILLFGHTEIQAQDIDKELVALSEKLAALVKENGKKKVTVLDFTDLQGGGSELGKYIAEELTVNLVIAKQGFSVLDRANLRRILAEHKLTASGLVDPENAKKLGMFAGVDALILGTIIPKGSNVNLNAKIITTDTAEIVGAARAAFQSDENVNELISSVSTGAFDLTSEKPQITKSFGDLRIELLSLEIINGSSYVLTMTLANPSKKNMWVAVKRYGNGSMPASLIDSNKTRFETFTSDVLGVATSEHYQNNLDRASEIKAGESITGTVRFYTSGRTPTPGVCSLQIEFLVGATFRDGYGAATAHNLITKMVAK